MGYDIAEIFSENGETGLKLLDVLIFLGELLLKVGETRPYFILI
jgi:hypothetical protein